MEAGLTGEDPAGGGEAVLVVEDEAAVLELTRRILERPGYRILAAAGSSRNRHPTCFLRKSPF